MPPKSRKIENKKARAMAAVISKFRNTRKKSLSKKSKSPIQEPTKEMNILIACHDYKKHKKLTLFMDDSNAIFLSDKNIKNISKLTEGKIQKISFIDTDESTKKDEFQYNSWNDIEDNTFDFIFPIFCPINICEYKSKLKENGTIIEFISGLKHKHPEESIPIEPIYPIIISPIPTNPIQNKGEKAFYQYNCTDTFPIKIPFHLDINKIPRIDDYGIVTYPLK